MSYRSLVTLLFLIVLLSAPAHSASIESLIMPGPVVRAHVDLEDECSNCHNLFDQSAQQQLCLDCHELIAEDLTKKEGFHALNPEIQESECKQCHTEHKGRDADIVGLQADLFQHDYTDLPLKGRHQGLSCEGCHSEELKYSEAPTECRACHESEDAHRGNLGEACGDCHDSSDWGAAQFDHSSTDFELIGKHQDAACNGCHRDQSYEETASLCIDCHRLDDKHGGARGDECESCHNSESWETSFDHEAETGFPLLEAHSALKCNNCHVSDDNYEGLPTDCQGCHRSNDIHLGRNGAECDQCHSEANWQVEFNHLAETDYELKSAHAELSCTDCHIGKLSDPLETECLGCHAADNPHGQSLASCADCHNQSAWLDELNFQHDLSRFPLVGLHRVVSCEQCHSSLEYSPLDWSCASCHKADDAHEEGFGEQCESCHNPVDWTYWSFDHDVQTDFKLEAAHKDLECAACHLSGTNADEQPTACYGCHRADDPHRTGFGRQCDQCHNTTSFGEIDMRR